MPAHALKTADVQSLACRGKTSPTYQPSMDMGSYVVIVNAEKVKVTGNKEQQKMYYRHTGRPGSLKEENFRKLQAVGFLPSCALSGGTPGSSHVIVTVHMCANSAARKSGPT